MQAELGRAGLVASPEGLKDPAYISIPHDSSDLSAGSVQGYFDADAPDPRLPGAIASAIVAAEGESGLGKCGDLLRADAAMREAYSDPRLFELLTILNEMIARLEDVGFEPDRHAVPDPEHERSGPPLAAFVVKAKKRGRGVRVAATCADGADGAEVSVWVESRAAARLFRKKDVFFLGWGGTLCDFLPPDRKSWRGWRSW